MLICKYFCATKSDNQQYYDTFSIYIYSMKWANSWIIWWKPFGLKIPNWIIQFRVMLIQEQWAGLHLKAVKVLGYRTIADQKCPATGWQKCLKKNQQEHKLIERVRNSTRETEARHIYHWGNRENPSYTNPCQTAHYFSAY